MSKRVSLLPLVVIPITACRAEGNILVEQAPDAIADTPAEISDAGTALVHAPWQCERCALGQPYFEGINYACPNDVAVWCRPPVDCSTQSFSASGIEGFDADCPPGFVVSAIIDHLPTFPQHICEKIPFPSGSYSECNASTCAPGFRVTTYSESVTPCGHGPAVFCTAP